MNETIESKKFGDYNFIRIRIYKYLYILFPFHYYLVPKAESNSLETKILQLTNSIFTGENVLSLDFSKLNIQKAQMTFSNVGQSTKSLVKLSW